MSENSPLVSIVMGVHLDEGTLSSSIKSILNQTYNNFEFIILNDVMTKKLGMWLIELMTRESPSSIKKR